MNPWLNYHHLFYFKCIAEEGSVSRAATKLRLGQPTLSAQLKLFEDTLGVQLFDRQHRRLQLTEHGKVALDYAKNIFKMGNEMYEALHDRMKPQKPSLHLGAIDSIAKQIVVRLAKHALRISPCQITMSEGSADFMLRELQAHRVDLFLCNRLPGGVDAKGLSIRALAKNNVGFYGAPKFKALRKSFPGSLSGVPMIFPTYESKIRQDLEHWGQLQKIDFNIVAESQDISVKKMMATNEIGLIPTTAYSVTQQVLQGELLEIGVIPGIHEELYLIKAQRKIENPIASKLMEEFQV